MPTWKVEKDGAYSGVLHWQKPSLGRYNCNVDDASFSHALNRVGLGMYIRDEEGRLVLANTEWLALLLGGGLRLVIGAQVGS
ncbi:hypothetical protein MTR_4g046657 [Medicago truncatula]|uniref:Uncharacterized protein n=1 Tax=Medicago truncatula TaxID=3880 RepID=A0A072UKK9_MEDTR|nr:hypothetical protein MTR_4g046657 [Medicago truncatula]